jgi:histidinol-phosphate aminotransferase
MLSPRPAVLTMPSYHPPLAGREGLRLDFNENTVGCSPLVLDRLRDLSFEDLARYPERGPVEKEVAEFLKVSPAELLLTNGVDEAIHLLCQTFLDPGDQALIVVPTYSMYRIYMLAAGAEVVTVPAGPNFEFPVEEVLQSITTRTRLIAIANPNNPTGTVVSKADLVQIAHAVPNAALLVDEAYFEFYGQSLLPDRGNFPNLFVARTFSKAYGMAGLRVGVLVGDPDQMRSVRHLCSPYNVNGIALACLPVALADQGYVQQYVREVKEARRLLEGALGDASIPFWPSQANFILMRIGSTEQAASFVEQMRRRGILVRDRSNDPSCAGCVRITLGPHEHTVRLLSALRATLPQPATPEGVSRR